MAITSIIINMEIKYFIANCGREYNYTLCIIKAWIKKELEKDSQVYIWMNPQASSLEQDLGSSLGVIPI